MKQFSTIMHIEIDGQIRDFHNYRYANSFDEATLHCNPDFNEEVIGEVVKEVDFDTGKSLELH